jgi:uncharacterized protein (TIGR02391 family)
MREVLTWFERVSRNAHLFSEARPETEGQHPFEQRDIHQALPKSVRKLFDNGHYPQATFEAFKFIDNEVRRHSRINKTGKALMMDALREVSPRIQLTDLATESARNEQEGYKFVFAGSIVGIRNPRGHDDIDDDVGTCLDHLGLASHLLRRLEQAGYAPKQQK